MDLIKLEPPSNIENERIMTEKGVSNFRGIFSKDRLPSLPNASFSMIINLEDFLYGNGTHWVAIYNHSSSSRDIEYFDSFGMKSPDVVYDYMLKAGKGIVYKSYMLQDKSSVLCGYYCIYYITNRYHGRSMVDILLDFTQIPSLHNELLAVNLI